MIMNRISSSWALAIALGGFVAHPAHASQDLLVSSEFTNSVKRFDGNTGAFKGDFVTAAAGTLNKPEGLAWASDGNLYVSSSGNNKVLRYNGSTGAFLGVAFSGNGLSRPWDMTPGPDGNLYVSSSGATSNKVLKFNPVTGAFIGTAANSASLVAPDGLTFGPDGNLYVCSTGNNRILKFNPATGALLGTFISGAAFGMTRQNDILFGNDGLAYVLDNTGLYRFSAAGALVDFWKPGAGSPGLALGPDGLFYTSTYESAIVSRFGGSADGVFIPAGSGGLSLPTNMLFFNVPAPSAAALLALALVPAARRRRT